MDKIVKDSSIWQNKNAFAALMSKECVIRVGMVRDTINPDTLVNGDTIKYVVEVFNNNSQVPVTCVPLNRMGGVWNYEEWTRRGYVHGKDLAALGAYAVRPGDLVLVAAINGDFREGVILGGLQHTGRTPALTIDDGIAYQSVFNGIVKHIDDEGAYTVTFNGMPTNISALLTAPTGNVPIPAPVYDPTISGSYYSFDASGSFTVSDGSQNVQLIKIDKPGGKVTMQAGAVVMVFDKNAQDVSIVTKTMQVSASTSIDQKTGKFTVEASTSAAIQSPKVAFGTSSVELLDQLSQLIDKLGAVTPISPVGPCTPLMATGQWAAVVAIQSKIKQITGSF